MNREELLAFVRQHRFCVQASVSPEGAPQASVVRFAVSDGFELIFDALDTTRKVANLRSNLRSAIVVGWDAGQTVQIEGITDEPTGAELERIKHVYVTAYPNEPERPMRGPVTYLRVRPTWARYVDVRPGGVVVELTGADLGSLAQPV